MELGKTQNLRAARKTTAGIYLVDASEEQVLLPNKFIPNDFRLGMNLDVFVYLDHLERPVATTQIPKIQLGEIAALEVMDVNQHGAFLDWGLDKQLFVPYSEMLKPMKAGETHLVGLYLDELTTRLAATSKIKPFLKEVPEGLEVNQKLNAHVYRPTPLGYELVVEGQFLGLIYKNELPKELQPGEALEVFVKHQREDGKVDLAIRPQGYDASIDRDVEKLRQALQAQNGYLGITDKSDPEEIRLMTKLSKKAFKKAVGYLYKNKMLKLEHQGIRLLK